MEKVWEHVVVLGAAGKMGSGIALLLLQEMACFPGSLLTLLDTNTRGFANLKTYLRQHLVKYAERNINRLRLGYKERLDIIDNGDVIEDFVEGALDRVRFVTSVEECRGATMIFEAILEDVEVKTQMFSKLKEMVNKEAYYFSNTSSIPIHILEKRSHLEGRLIGFHFYNPPAIQKLLEIIIPADSQHGGKELALKVGEQLNKTIVFSKDIAGFIGNGHFIREMDEACEKVEEISKKITISQAICTVNYVTQEFLLRPMGIFQLIDYVGIDVCQHIAKVMTTYLPGQVFNAALIDSMVAAGVKGGQHADGSQKEGFFSYEKGKPIKVYDLEKRTYIPYAVKEEVKVLPKEHEPWKVLSKDRDKNRKIDEYFKHLLVDQSQGAKLAQAFLERSLTIVQQLVADGVAKSIADVDTVLQQGFFHLYGVEAPWQDKGGK